MSYKEEAKRLLCEQNILLSACDTAIAYARAALEATGLTAEEIKNHYIIRRLKSAMDMVSQGGVPS